jgi:hypothetical protein
MITFLTNIAPIALGFLAKLFALKQHAASENQKLMMQGLQARNDSINQAHARAERESPMAALNRRVIIFVILAMVVFTQVAPVFFNVPTIVPVVEEGWNLLGFLQLTPDVVEYVKLEAGSVVKMQELMSWCSLIIEFYFGAQLAKK